MAPGIAVEVLLDRDEHGVVDDCRMCPRIDLVLVDDLAEVDAVAQQMKQCAAAERRTSGGATGPRGVLLGDDARGCCQTKCTAW